MGYDIEKEKREAIEAGRRALNSLRTAKENLNSAKNWGLVDMFGGGFFTTLLKHSKMDQSAGGLFVGSDVFSDGEMQKSRERDR